VAGPTALERYRSFVGEVGGEIVVDMSEEVDDKDELQGGY